MRASNGAELLLHVGIDTVALNGTGFETLVQPGQHVRVGDSLLRFDLDRVARLAPSLVTPMIVTNSTEFQITRRVQGLAVLAGDSVMELRRLDAASAGVSDRAVGGAGAAAQLSLRVSLEHGLHARPAALVVRTAREFDADVHLRAHGRQRQRPQRRRADVARCAPQRRHRHRGRRPGRRARRRGPGNDPARALRARVARNERAADNRATWRVRADGAAAGCGVGRCRRIARLRAWARPFASCGASAMSRSTGTDSRTRHWNSTARRGEVRTHLRALAGRVEGPQHEIAAAHLEFLDDPELAPRRRVGSRRARAQHMRGAGPYVRASMPCARSAMHGSRSASTICCDLESQVLGALAGEPPAAALALPGQAILIANDLLPSQIVDAGPGRDCRNLHCAWRRDLACRDSRCGDAEYRLWCRWGPGVLAIDDGTPLLLDAEAGLLRRRSTGIRARRGRTARSANVAPRERYGTGRCARRLCHRDGVRIEVFANIATAADARDAVQLGAEGCGLLRTEFLFLDRQIAPGVDEQTREYQRIIDAFAHRPVVIRTLDVGGDKPIPYLPLPREDNPALGLRGVRDEPLASATCCAPSCSAILRVRPSAQLPGAVADGHRHRGGPPRARACSTRCARELGVERPCRSA